jgi:hypothetical protein
VPRAFAIDALIREVLGEAVFAGSRETKDAKLGSAGRTCG